MSAFHAVETAQRARRRRGALTLLGAVLVAAVSYVLLLGSGPLPLTPAEVIAALTGGGTSSATTVVWDIRLPVAIATAVVGAALGIAGAWTQTMSRNPLASPDILGVSGGAAVAVVAGTVLARPAWSAEIDTFWWRAGLALIGALVIVVLLLTLGGFGTSHRVVLIGFALSLLCQALVSYFIVRADLSHAADAQTWLACSTGFVRWEAIAPMCAGLVPFLALGLWQHRDVPLLAHDDALATSLGVRVPRVRACLLIAATGIVAVVVSVVGPIGFVALIAPQVARLISGAPTPPPWNSAAVGAALLLLCSVIATRLPVSIPVGLVTSALGGVTLVVLVITAATRMRKAVVG
ncbi:iron ABC transporter permease [Corynebacterium sp. 21KM1197]|uniref:FecCD family ABC transporter permease n=1 Tax=Corynebacterium sp. 21KM1197 TaxID=2989734 RepID=UPI0029C9E8D4|nr:iron ABC transporter permease [Corynebacterium sp. 21KM1197]WPF68161.1 iron ABC transporter permease [Corynebacterium sp. 21KM1197]